jgi:hypothetical protein
MANDLPREKQVAEDDDRRSVGDTWTFVAIDADTKLVPAFMVGRRDSATTHAFIADVARRMANRVQISTDGLRSYIDAIGYQFGAGGVDYAQLHKTYEAEPTGPGRYSPPKVIEVEKTPIFGAPDEDLVSTSYVERQNLTVRMGSGVTRDSHFAHYNFVRRHGTLRVSPAMAAGLFETLWSTEELLNAALDGVAP